MLETANGWTETYDHSGKLLYMEHINGDRIDLAYNERGQLVTVMDHYGRELRFTYASNLKLYSVEDALGYMYTYAYDELGNLIKVTYPDLTPSDDTDNPTREYHYEDTNYPTYLTGITNENSVRYATWKYDDSGRAVSSTHAGFENGTLEYLDSNNTRLTNSLGHQRTYTSTVINKVSRPVEITDAPCVDCTVGTKQYAYDENGFLSSLTKQSGQIIDYVRNDFGLETSRTEATGTQQARTIATEWHADFRKPIRITEPDRIIEYTYDSAGRLLTKTESAVP